MIPYQKERIENAICFFASEHQKRSQKPTYQTFIYKYLAMLDFMSIKETGQPVLGLNYVALERGPVPEEIYCNKKFMKSDLYEFEKCDLRDNEAPNIRIVRAKKEPDMSFFSKNEIKMMENILSEFAKPCIITDVINSASHRIEAYHIAWKARGNKKSSQMRYGDMFKGIEEKSLGELSFAEENFLIYSSLEDC